MKNTILILLSLFIISCQKNDIPSPAKTNTVYWDSTINCHWNGSYSDTVHESKPYPHLFFELNASFPDATNPYNEAITFWVRATGQSNSYPIPSWTKLPLANVWSPGDSIVSRLNAVYYVYGNSKITPPNLDIKASIQNK